MNDVYSVVRVLAPAATFDTGMQHFMRTPSLAHLLRHFCLSQLMLQWSSCLHRAVGSHACKVMADATKLYEHFVEGVHCLHCLNLLYHRVRCSRYSVVSQTVLLCLQPPLILHAHCSCNSLRSSQGRHQNSAASPASIWYTSHHTSPTSRPLPLETELCNWRSSAADIEALPGSPKPTSYGQGPGRAGGTAVLGGLLTKQLAQFT